MHVRPRPARPDDPERLERLDHAARADRPGARATPAPRARRLSAAAALVLGAAGAVVVALTGSPGWAVVRVALVLLVAAVVAAAQRRGVRAAGWSAVGTGCVAAPAAGVVAGDHLAAGALARGAAAAVATAAALVLLAVGTWALLRATRGWWRLAALPVAFVLLQFVVVPTTMAVLPTNRAPAPLGDLTPADHGLVFEDVTLRTGDGVDLAAWYVPGENGAAVLLLHGAGSTRTSTLEHADALASLGYGVLVLDARGHGGSGGTAMDLGWYGDADIAPAVDWLLARPDVDGPGVGVVGLSMGGEEALTAAAGDPRIRAVVAEGVGVRVAADAVPEGWLADVVNAWTTTLTDLLTQAPRPAPLRELLASYGPDQVALLIAGRGEVAQAEWVTGEAPSGIEIWAVPDAGHTAALDVHPQEWVERVAAVLDSALLAPGEDPGPGDREVG